VKKRIFFSVADLPNTRSSIGLILDQVAGSDLAAETDVTICHTDNFSWDLKSELGRYDLDLKFINTGYSIAHHEYPALHQLWLESQQSDFYALYLHTKGASKTTDTEQLNAAAWSRIMLHGVVHNHRLCEYHLDRGADVVGSLWYRHFKGNFWWARSDYLRTITDPILMDHDYRNHAEFWCAWGSWWGRVPPPKVKNLFYLSGYQSDTDFSELEASAEFQTLDINSQRVFMDKRLDASQPSTIEERLSEFDFSVFDKIVIAPESEHLIPELRYFLNYDGIIVILDPATHQQLKKIHYSEI
jgi:hypothetical protein